MIYIVSSLIKIFTNTHLPTFFWQTNSDEVVNKHQQSLLNFQSNECLRNYLLHVVSHIFAKTTFEVRTNLRAS